MAVGKGVAILRVTVTENGLMLFVMKTAIWSGNILSPDELHCTRNPIKQLIRMLYVYFLKFMNLSSSVQRF